jgi:hypothetical protein
MKNVNHVEIDSELIDAGLVACIRNPDKPVDLFPRYWATVCYVQRVPLPFDNKTHVRVAASVISCIRIVTMVITTHRSRLLSLPMELKRLILGYLLSSSEPLAVWLPTEVLRRNASAPNFRFAPEILRVNQQLCIEGTAILYSNAMKIQLPVECEDLPECKGVRTTSLYHYDESRQHNWEPLIHVRKLTFDNSLAMFSKFDISVVLDEHIHKLRTEQAVQIQVMRLNDERRLSIPTPIMLSFDRQMPKGRDEKCSTWSSELATCEAAGRCPAGRHRLSLELESAAYILSLSGLRKTSVTYKLAAH